MKELIIGGLYFMLQYADPDFLFLVPTPMVFLGRKIDGEEEPEEPLWVFQDSDSYCQLGPCDTQSTSEQDEQIKLYAVREKNLFQVVDFEGLRAALLECQARWFKAGKPAKY